MGRRKTKAFGWVRDEEEGEAVEVAPTGDDVDDVDEGPRRPERVAHRGHMDGLSELVDKLARLPPSVRRTLPLEPEALEQLEHLASLGPTPARRRQALRVRAFVRDADRVALDEILAGRSPREAALQRVERVRRRLLAGTDDDLAAFVAEHEHADRQELRTAVRDARGEGPAAARASKRLFQLIKATLGEV